MNHSIPRIRFSRVFRAFGTAALVAVSLLASIASPSQAAERGRMPLTPEQRRDMRGQVSPDERQAMRQRFIERQQGNRPPNEFQNAPPRRQLSPEERQRLRQQIEQARDQYRRGNAGNRGPSK